MLHQISIQKYQSFVRDYCFPCSPPLFFTELSDDKVNARVISLVTALYLSILEGYTLVSPFDVPAGPGYSSETSSPKSVLKRHSINSSSKTSLQININTVFNRLKKKIRPCFKLKIKKNSKIKKEENVSLGITI